ncbi:DNA mismatch repair protein [MutS] [Thermoplasma volcanium GSS1]|uniref:DNA mismatch repair protein [MutS] n=1 Tax=Thermoplasma volcanium (strain ATCC 51530 / DSM 4299 / JCM 9571 / NBRC 15438 / GSS1) TaxID=273116 RepID=Q97AY6_THEVO|nr:MutS family DNA mismatch repair protein [Thermoplasma volcanium]BAB59815.1 DNA mismatch repair protein [MutS] [Thermoplasma volcanium GSS1]
MNVDLLFNDTDGRVNESVPWNSNDLEKDLDLEILYNVMAGKDTYVFDVCRRTILNSVNDKSTIIYRQDVLKDAIRNQNIIRKIYSTIVTAESEAKRSYFWISRSNPEFALHESISILKIYLTAIENIRDVGREALPLLHSNGLKQLFTMIMQEFNHEYVAEVLNHLEILRFHNGISVRGSLGFANSLIGYNLLMPDAKSNKILDKISLIRERHYTYVLPDRDEIGAQELADMRAKSIRETAAILTESAQNVLAFIDRIKEGVAFYLGCLNLLDELTKIGAPISFPVPENNENNGMYYTGIYDVALCLRTKTVPVRNSLSAEHDSIIFITGANRGGKSTLLRAIGQAQLMMQCGMFVAAESFSAYIASGIFTHFKREEDSGMSMGKLEEEMNRMSLIIDHIKAGGRLFLNESFSSTNVREGSEIAKQVINALLDSGVKVIFVTHFNELAESYLGSVYNPTFLRAERLDNGKRTFKILQADPITTSFGYDIFLKVFGESAKT